jgi:hypothetical protein
LTRTTWPCSDLSNSANVFGKSLACCLDMTRTVGRLRAGVNASAMRGPPLARPRRLRPILPERPRRGPCELIELFQARTGSPEDVIGLLRGRRRLSTVNRRAAVVSIYPIVFAQVLTTLPFARRSDVPGRRSTRKTNASRATWPRSRSPPLKRQWVVNGTAGGRDQVPTGSSLTGAVK